MPSLGPDDLKRQSHRFSNLLFQHNDTPLPPSSSSPHPDHIPDDGYFQQHDLLSPTRPLAGRALSRARSSILGAAAGNGLKSRRASRGYDGEFLAELEGEGGNGVRSWYGQSPSPLSPPACRLDTHMNPLLCLAANARTDNFTTVDWLHDAVKHSIRLRRVRQLKRTHGLRGYLINLWDGAQGWVLVTLIGFLTACIAFAIIRSEMWLFDLKEGYCLRDWRLAHRFCCSEDHGGGGSTCPAWRTWGQVGRDKYGFDRDLAAYAVYAVLALGMATLASTLTIYFTASTSVYSSKDSSHAAAYFAATETPKTDYGATDSTAASETPATRDSDPDPDAAAPAPPPSSSPLKKPRARKTLYYAAGSGIPEIKTILSGFVIRGYLGSWTLAVKAGGLALSVASGLSLGKEGPFVHIASCVGNILSRFFRKYDRNEGKRREILSAACAAGVAVSFGAPVGGVLFSLEEVSYYFPPRTMLRSFWCAMVAALTLKVLNPFGSGKIVLFAITYDRDWHSFELLGFVALAVFGGVYGALFCKANVAWTKYVRNGTSLKAHPILEVALVTFLTTAISFYNPWSKMGGTELISELFSECYKDDRLSGLCVTQPAQVFPLVGSLLLALALKAALTTITFG